jgi:hypothetical protein
VVQITVSDEFARQLAGAAFPIVLVDSRGRKLGEVTPLPVPPATVESNCAEDEWSEAKRQMDIYRREGGNFYTTREVLEHLKSLEKE